MADHSSTIKPQSHLPSLHPVLHRSSHLPQSNLSFPSFSLTALCASHIHSPNSLRELTRGALPARAIHAWKSEPQCQHGYRVENDARNCRALVWTDDDARSGYVAVMLCSSVQDARPSASTSGGQSGGDCVGGGAGVVVCVEVAGSVAVCFLVMAAQDAKEVQERQLVSATFQRRCDR